MRFCVQREGAAHLRDRLTLRLLLYQLKAATADQLKVFIATVRNTTFRGTMGIRPGHWNFPMCHRSDYCKPDLRIDFLIQICVNLPCHKAADAAAATTFFLPRL
jgi:hypothetical protein